MGFTTCPKSHTTSFLNPRLVVLLLLCCDDWTGNLKTECQERRLNAGHRIDLENIK
jgi:hypothetical protein